MKYENCTFASVKNIGTCVILISHYFTQLKQNIPLFKKGDLLLIIYLTMTTWKTYKKTLNIVTCMFCT